jgi:hypothetical protein
MIKALDYKAIGNYEKVVLEEHPNGWGAGGFVNLSGFKPSIGSIDKLLDTGRCPLFRYDLTWSDKNHVYDSSFRRVVKARAQAIKPIVETHPNLKHFVNPVTEHKLKEREWLVFADIVEQVLGESVEIVNVPLVRSGFVSKKYLNEYHGEEKTPRTGGRYCFSADGTSLHDLFVKQFLAAYSEAVYFMGWIPQFNGNRKVGESDPRPNRIYWPTNKQMDALIYILNNIDGSGRFPRYCIGKSVSDQAKGHKVPVDKDCKPVFLAELPAKINAKKIVLKAANGQTIATSRDRMSWDDEANHKQIGWRWYFNEWGMDISAKARRLQDGVGGGWVIADGKRIAVWDLAFRAGKQR